MVNHLSDSEIARYRQRLSPPEELLRTDEHLTQCTECRTRVIEEARLSVGTHLAYEQMEGYVDKTIGPLERQKILAHTRVCPVCAGELQDLEDLRAEIQAAPAQAPAARGGRISVGRASIGSGIGPWRGLITLRRRPAVAVAAAAAIVLAVAFLGWGMPDWHPDTPPPQDVLTADERSDVQEAVKTGDIRLAQPLGILRGADRALLGPADTQTASLRLDPVGEWIRQTTPLLQWSAPPLAMGYAVEIFDDHLTLIQRSPPLHEPRWQVDGALERGRVYLWQVTVTFTDGEVVSLPRPPAPEARFGVLGGEQVAELQRVERARPDAHLDLGILYARAGLLKDAEQELLKVIPTDGDFDNAQRLLATVGRLRTGAGPPGPGATEH
jgi:hypothetical protein